MISTFSSTIRRKEMDAVLTCMVDEKIGPGEMNTKLTQYVKEFFGVAGSVAFRNSTIALSYVFTALNLEKSSKILISALAPSWHFTAVKSLGFEPVVLDVDENTGLVTAEIIKENQNGASVLIFHESLGILPSSEEFSKILSLGLFIIEDVSHSVGSAIDLQNHLESEDDDKKELKKAGTFGVFSILGLEENDTVTGGGGSVLFAPNRRDWITLKNLIQKAPKTDILPDLNSALAFVQLKEFSRNEEARKKIFDLYKKSLTRTSIQKNRTFERGMGENSTVWMFPVVLSGSFNEASQYAKRKDVEIVHAYSDSVVELMISLELEEIPIHAKSLYLRTVLFPLYPRMNGDNITKVTKILATLP